MKHTTIVLTASLLAPATQAQPSQEHQNALTHMANVMEVVASCPEYQANHGLIEAVNRALRIDPNKLENAAFIVQKRLALRDTFNKNPDVACATGWFLYGANGMNVKNLLQKK